MAVFKVVSTAIAGIVLGVVGLAVAWQYGYVSRVVAVAKSADGSVEAVCRGRLPESTEYDLWLRERGESFGRRVGAVGSEGMGRCRQVFWSPGGDYVAVLSEGGYLSVVDGRQADVVAARWLVQPGGRYPMERVVARAGFESADVVVFEHCARLWHTTHRREDIGRCGSDPVSGRIELGLR
jgi:hypothetical protein